MMHSNGFILGVKDSNRNVLREIGDKVFIPFQSQYSLLIKNNNAVRAAIAVSIDGTDVLGGGELILNAYDSVDLERFVVDGNLNCGQRFKFVPLGDSQVADPSEPQNGIIEVKFWKEKPKDITFFTAKDWGCRGIVPPPGTIRPENVFRCDSMMMSDPGPKTSDVQDNAVYSLSCQNVVGEPGATVAGSHSGQQFRHGTFGIKDGEPTIIRLRMVGKKVDCPLTVNQTKKVHCTKCGKKSSFNDKFCRFCGTKLKKEYVKA